MDMLYICSDLQSISKEITKRAWTKAINTMEEDFFFYLAGFFLINYQHRLIVNAEVYQKIRNFSIINTMDSMKLSAQKSDTQGKGRSLLCDSASV